MMESGFVKAVTGLSQYRIYLPTPKSYLYLKNSFSDKTFCRSVYEIDKYTFDHDLCLQRVRAGLEKINPDIQWISEKYLIDYPEEFKAFTSEFRPDAILIRNNTEKVALELELARKSKKRYQEKIKRYVQILLSGNPDSPFQKVHFICRDQAVIEILKEEVQLLATYFEFTLLNSILNNQGGQHVESNK